MMGSLGTKKEVLGPGTREGGGGTGPLFLGKRDEEGKKRGREQPCSLGG